jgi:Zn-finger in ubiquitin-hydrolases and other protein
MATKCTHLDQVREVTPSGQGCEECLKTGDRWVALRVCQVCGHVGSCDSSKGRHATGHFQATNHPIIRPLGSDDWTWCYLDKAYV